MLIVYHWSAKVLIEVLATPLTYKAVGYLKRKEGSIPTTKRPTSILFLSREGYENPFFRRA